MSCDNFDLCPMMVSDKVMTKLLLHLNAAITSEFRPLGELETICADFYHCYE